MDRFDLEQQIVQCWKIIDDARELSGAFLEGQLSCDPDNVCNHFGALSTLYDIKFQKLWNIFEQLLKQGDLK